MTVADAGRTARRAARLMCRLLRGALPGRPPPRSRKPPCAGGLHHGRRPARPRCLHKTAGAGTARAEQGRARSAACGGRPLHGGQRAAPTALDSDRVRVTRLLGSSSPAHRRWSGRPCACFCDTVPAHTRPSSSGSTVRAIQLQPASCPDASLPHATRPHIPDTADHAPADVTDPAIAKAGRSGSDAGSPPYAVRRCVSGRWVSRSVTSTTPSSRRSTGPPVGRATSGKPEPSQGSSVPVASCWAGSAALRHDGHRACGVMQHPVGDPAELEADMALAAPSTDNQ